MPFGLQPTHLILVLVVAVLIFGPSRLPEIGRSFGSTLREFQKGMKEATEGLSGEVTAAPASKENSTIACTSCGKAIQMGAKFCPECGAAQSAAQ
jgi:sec-independent protein translocase protein TatA